MSIKISDKKKPKNQDDRILDVQLDKWKPFKTLTDALKDLLIEVNLEFKLSSDETNQNGITISTIDNTRTVIIIIKLYEEHFKLFKCKEPNLILGLNLPQFYKNIKQLNNDDTLSLFIEPGDTNNLRIAINNKIKNTYIKQKLLDLKINDLNLEPLSFLAKVTIKSDEFHTTCREMNNIAENVTIKCYKSKFILSCKGESDKTTIFSADGDTVAISFRKTEDNQPNIVQGTYELKNIVIFSKCGNLCDSIEIYMNNNFPLLISYTVASLGKFLLMLTHIIDDVLNNDYALENEYYTQSDYNDEYNEKEFLDEDLC